MIELLPLEILLMEYAAGHLAPYEGFMVAAHLTMKPEARKKVRALEALSGKRMEHEVPAAISQGCLDRVMEKINAPKAAPAPCNEKLRHMTASADVPPAIAALLNTACSDDSGCWKPMARGIECIQLKICTSEPTQRKLRLMRLAPHQQTPPHAHDGREIMLVLEGGFSDTTGTYGPGDLLIVADPTFIHAPKATAEGCLCLTLTDAPLRFKRRVLQVMNIFWRV